MPIVYDFLSPESAGHVANESGRGQAQRENRIRRLEAQDRANLQANQIASVERMNYARMAEHEQDRLAELYRTQYQGQVDIEERGMQNRADLAKQDAYFEQQNYGQARDFNEQRMLKKEEWIDEGIKKGEFRFSDEDRAKRSRLYADLSKARAARHFTPEERLRAESQIVEQIEALQPMPVPPDERPVPTHEKLNSSMVRMTPGGAQPIGGQPLRRGEEYFVPQPDGTWEARVFEEAEHKAELAAAEKRAEEAARAAADKIKADAEAAKEAASGLKPDIETFSRMYDAARKALTKKQNTDDGPIDVPPDDDEVKEYLRKHKSVYDEIHGGGAGGGTATEAETPVQTPTQAPVQQPAAADVSPQQNAKSMLMMFRVTYGDDVSKWPPEIQIQAKEAKSLLGK